MKPENEHEAIMEALNDELPEILNEAEGHMHMVDDAFQGEEYFFLNNNPFFVE